MSGASAYDTTDLTLARGLPVEFEARGKSAVDPAARHCR
ncbi:MAG: hypothetical protein JWP25_4287 [Bradyrhizobium sp.]|nr:hypothetical protein [Bradyrhizobium sp.]